MRSVSNILNQLHEAEIHVQLLVAVKERRTRVVGDEIELDLLKPAKHHDVLNNPSGRFAADAHQLEAVAVQMQRMDIVARIAKFEPVALALVHGELGGSWSSLKKPGR